MKIIYYVVEKDLQSVGDTEELSGWKVIRIYHLVGDEMTLITSLEVEISDNSKNEVLDYLIDSDEFEDGTQFKLIQL